MLIDKRHNLLSGTEADSSVYEPWRLRERLELLDSLDAGFGDLEPGAFGKDAMRRAQDSAHLIRSGLEAINAEVYRSIRSEIVRRVMHGPQEGAVLRWFQTSASGEATGNPAPGIAYDWRDDLLSGILQLREPVEQRDLNRCGAREMVFYQPTPARHILRLIAACALSEEDVFVDLGSGLGHVPLLVSMMTGGVTGVKCLGIEVEAAYVATARECAHSLHLDRVQFIHDDARSADLSGGTVFYLYSAFTGSIMADVLARLRKESAQRRIRIGTLGPCTSTIAREPWLTASTLPDPNQITVFTSGD